MSTFSRIDADKTERPDGRNCILVYGYGKHHTGAIAETAQSVGIDGTLPLEPRHLGVRIRDLLDGSVTEGTFEHEVSEPIIVMSALSDAEMNAFMDRFRGLGIPRPLFAVVTPTSRNWRFGDLALELGKERREIAAAQRRKAEQG